MRCNRGFCSKNPPDQPPSPVRPGAYTERERSDCGSSGGGRGGRPTAAPGRRCGTIPPPGRRSGSGNRGPFAGLGGRPFVSGGRRDHRARPDQPSPRHRPLPTGRGSAPALPGHARHVASREEADSQPVLGDNQPSAVGGQIAGERGPFDPGPRPLGPAPCSRQRKIQRAAPPSVVRSDRRTAPSGRVLRLGDGGRHSHIALSSTTERAISIRNRDRSRCGGRTSCALGGAR